MLKVSIIIRGDYHVEATFLFKGVLSFLFREGAICRRYFLREYCRYNLLFFLRGCYIHVHVLF
jgi:hypothetical protein